jgi:catechol 2,3-dioxygenase-like lactoylglutathione lyase family enzyme
MSNEPDAVTPDGTIPGFDHVALPMQETQAMILFYRALGLEVVEAPLIVQVRFGDQMINFHRPEWWQRGFRLRASEAKPPCGDLCLVWRGSAAALRSRLERAAARIVEGPVDRQGGRGVTAPSVYVHDPDGNLLEFIRYAEDGGGG